MTTGTKDEFDAARDVAAILETVDESKRHQVIRWALEKLGMKVEPLVPSPPGTPEPVTRAPTGGGPSGGTTLDIKAFIDAKAPKSQNELVATVAYYHQFEAAEGNRQDHIGEKELLEACRLANRHRPGYPAQVLVNACGAGLLDRVSKGRYKINSVGENLVAMVLPHKPGDGGKPFGGSPSKAKRASKPMKIAKSKRG